MMSRVNLEQQDLLVPYIEGMQQIFFEERSAAIQY
jgi:hypothetical protein